MIDDDKNVLNINVFTKLIKAVQDFSNFESNNTLFLYGFHFFTQQKKNHV